MTELPLTLRPLADATSERNLVRQSWLRTAWKSWIGSETGQGKADYYALHPRIVERLIARGTVLVAEVTPGELAGELAGWACFDAGALHYVYTKYTYRRMGVARRLLAECPARHASYWTWAARDCPLFRDFTFNPYLAFEEASS